jgi:ABC-2 type transport system permease protein
MNFRREFNAVLTIAFRDFTKLLRDRARIISSLIFPLLFVGAFGAGAEQSLGKSVGFNYLTFIFTGVFAQTLFQSTASGVIFLIQDRESDFSQEIFVSPISRYTILIGKIIGETLVSYVQVIGVIALSFIMGVDMSLPQLIAITSAGIMPCLLGGAFGVIVMANLTNVRSATQVFPFLIFPQFFLSGVFFPLKDLQFPLNLLSHLAPMTYAVDFIRGVFYLGKPDYDKVVLYSPIVNLTIFFILFSVMLIVGTFLFVRNERNR